MAARAKEAEKDEQRRQWLQHANSFLSRQAIAQRREAERERQAERVRACAAEKQRVSAAAEQQRVGREALGC